MDLVIVASHPIQYQACVWRELAALGQLSFEVWYGSDYGVRPQPSPWGPSDFVWDVDLVSGYPHRFLPNWSRRPDPQSYGGKLYPPLVAELALRRPRSVLIQGYRNLHEQLAFLGAKLGGARVIFRADTNSLSPRRAAIARLKNQLLPRFYDGVDAFLSIGPANERHYREHGVPDSKLFIAPYGVDDEFFGRMRERWRGEKSAVRAQFGIPVGAQVVMFAGVLTPVKAVEVLVKAISRLPSVHLLLAGSGKEERALRDVAASSAPGRVHFAGFLNQTQLPKAYAAADVFCLPSRYEPWGLVVNEAIAMGLPVVVTDICGVAPDVASTGAGLVVPSESADALATALSEVLRQPGRFDEGIARFGEMHRTRLTAEALARAVRG